MHLSYPKIERMASGNLSLAISGSVSWEEFPTAARSFLTSAGGFTLFKADTAVERCWIVLVRLRPFFLAQDEMGMSLDSIARLGNGVLRSLHQKLSTTDDA